MKFFLLAFWLVTGHNVLAQTTAPFDASTWTIVGKMEKETFQGKEGIRLTGGAIYLKDSTFMNGIIEFDMTLSRNRYFPGFGFRIQDNENFEHIYLRPHQLGNPDAIQYMPVFNRQEAWQLYYGDGYSTAVTYPLDEWVHIRLVVLGTQAEVYVGDQSKPALVIHQLKRAAKPGKISLDNGAPIVTRYANFQYTKTDNPTLLGTYKQAAPAKPGTIMSWHISNTFDEKRLDNDYTIPQDLAKQATWNTLPAENTGVVNLSQISKLREGLNTVFAKVTLLSDKPQIKKLQLGFSDRAKVYCNGRLLYSGQDVFMSRDYRFLGTIGYFDDIYLDLKKGKNELWIAVSETFGGWGIQGIIADQSGLTIE
ncbi:LamG domain-containing protein [Spirosoma endbachense]|uniref:DUF1080 domain-containing protein n=1 Tax=Spirosoma endbachense TaxID=2666025 RepID=A0A6P1WB16_9BACT|nr:hypothetical protein [Spirosoma endbachense]QHW00957.1 hypothetical protein GJR95_40615 [Spirosoma endbachense]